MAPKTKLELTWIGKDQRPRLEPRILMEDPTRSYHAATRRSEKDIFDNRLIFGDNLLALKALEQEFAGQVSCIYIDPPFNTGQAFPQYADGIEHSLWLTLLRDRVCVLRTLLSASGTLWLHLDDSEAHRARCVLDEEFGIENFIGTVIWEKSDSPRMDAEFFSVRHDYIYVYARDVKMAKFIKLKAKCDETPAHYDKTDEHGRAYYLKPLRAMGGQGETRAARPNLYFKLEAPDGTPVFPIRQDGSDGAWRWSPKKCQDERARIEWKRGKTGWTPYFRIYKDPNAERPPETIWGHEDVGSNRTSKLEAKNLVGTSDPFATPKPERLIRRILDIATEPSDLVLDSFAGSGTTGAVAHKMGRRWIMVELGEHCNTHIIPRMKKVIDGEDPGGITDAVGWKGGGGFRYYRLAPSLLEKDRFGNWIISKQYNAAMLAEAICKLEGFTYAPSETEYWKQGHSTERDFIYVTTQTLGREELQHLSDEVGPRQSLLVLCGAFRVRDLAAYPNLTVKKIPKAVMSRCEWGKDDYSLEIRNLPAACQPEPEAEVEKASKGRSKATTDDRTQGDLFGHGVKSRGTS